MPKKFVPRQRKHKVLAREKASKFESGDAPPVPEVDSNALEILPEDQEAAKEARREQLRQELKGDSQISGKKAKRLEKYIDNKLKKDENRALLAKLSQNKIDTSLFASSRSLGQGKETKRQALSRAWRENQAGISQEDDVLFERNQDSKEVDSADESDDSEPETNQQPAVKSSVISAPTEQNGEHIKPAEQGIPIQTKTPVIAGAGLKRPLEVDDEGRPVIPKRQKRGGVKTKLPKPTPIDLDMMEAEQESESESADEWNGFSSDGADSDASTSEDGTSDSNDEEESTEGEDEDDESSEEDDDEDKEADVGGKQRSSAFKAWAHEQRNEALGYKPVEADSTMLDIPVPKNFKPRAIEQDPLPQELLPTTKNIERKAFSVDVERPQDIQNARLELPVVGEEQKIMEAIHNNNVVVICGATGSGKTTQVPQFLFEAGYGSPDSPTPGLIGVTQPRKVAAVSMANRVGQELGNHSKAVAYQIRFEGTADSKTAIKFMTDGVLLREVASDIALRRYSAIIIDEAHERSVNTDILVGMLSRVVKLREEMSREDSTVKPLKLIIMSATLRVDDVTKNPVLFPTPPPVLDIQGRQHPVTVHFARQTKHDYVEEAYTKILRGHRKLPPGGMLVFLTGHDEISRLSKKLKLASGGLNPAALPKVRISANDAPLEVEDIDFGETEGGANDDDDGLPFIDEEDDANEEDDAEFDIPDETESGPTKMHVLPLYSLLPTKEQMRVFEDPPEGHRQIILATNVAETSLTIPGIRYVFDCGRSKERRYNRENGVQSYEIGWISKASASQRAGRAGRTGPGHCWRLYSSAVYERDFAEFADPELLRMPIEGIVLQLKAMRLQHVVNFPFPTPPDRRNIAKAEKLLQYLSAINSNGQASQIGTTMAKFPLPPRFARILLVGHLHDCLPYTVALVAGLSVAEVFVPESQAIPALPEQTEISDNSFRTHEDVAAENRQAQMRRKFNEAHRNFRALDDASEAIKLLQVVGEFAHEPTESWCQSHFVRYKPLIETQKLRRQITSLLQKDIPAFANLKFREKLDRPSEKQISALKQMVAAGFIDQVAIRADLSPQPPEMYRKPRRAIDVPYLPLQPLESSSSSSSSDNSNPLIENYVYVHPTSSLAHHSPQELPEYIIYSGLQRAAPSPSSTSPPKTRMLALTDVTGAQLASLTKGTPLVSYGKPIKEVSSGGADSKNSTTREVWVIPYLRAETGGNHGQGWPLPARKVVQKKVVGRGWVVE